MRDPYARNWQIVGTVTASSLAWILPAADFKIWLAVTMGVGQYTVRSFFDVRALITAFDPWYEEQADNFQIVKSFAITGGLLGHSINAQMFFQIPALIPPANLPVKFSTLISPYAAGSGI